MSAHNIPFSVLTKKIKLNYPKSAAMGLFSYGLENEFETAMVNEPSVFKPLKFYCMSLQVSKVSHNQQGIRRKKKSLNKMRNRKYKPRNPLSIRMIPKKVLL